MSGPPNDQLLASDAERRAVETELSDACAQGRLSLEELSERVGQVNAARTRGELAVLVGDLPGTVPPAASDIRPTRWTVAIMGGNIRRGRWRPSERTTGVAVMGGTVLDLREAAIGSRPQQVTAIALMGGVHVVVPEGTRVELHGVPLMGSTRSQVPSYGDAHSSGEPVVHVRAFALMGGVRVQSKPASDAVDSDMGVIGRRSRRAARQQARLAPDHESAEAEII
jgi:hypothetical protein